MENQSLYKHFYDENVIYESILHDIKTPLSIMGFYIKELEEYEHNKEVNEIIKKLKDNLDRVTNIVNITTKEISKFKLKSPKYINKDILEETNKIFEEINKVLNNSNKKIHIKSSLKDNVIAIDPLYFYAIITNVASNSLKFARNKVILTISKVGTFVEIKVKNDGKINEDVYKHILEPYVKTTSMNDEGSGLGLYIAEILVRSLDGEIEINSKNEKVSTIIRLPMFKI